MEASCEADVKPNGKGPSMLLLGTSNFLGPALLDAFGGARAANTHCKQPVNGSLFCDTRSTRVSGVLDGLPVEPAAAIVLLGILPVSMAARAIRPNPPRSTCAASFG